MIFVPSTNRFATGNRSANPGRTSRTTASGWNWAPRMVVVTEPESPPRSVFTSVMVSGTSSAVIVTGRFGVGTENPRTRM